MDNVSQVIEALLRLIHEVEWSTPGSCLCLTLRYSFDDQEYWGWAPPRDNPFTPTGIRDPALGNTGPLEFAEIDLLKVDSFPRHRAPDDAYDRKFKALAARARSIEGVLVSDDSISVARHRA